MYAEQSVHEIVLPCDNPKKNDYTFVLTIGVSICIDCDVCLSKDMD